ncbi:MAG: hypothetical protein Ct9H300mP12_08340 [Acidimicrobiales bacterium]|nr:MAG: hypothetical protein Ct9H300mP12_08340 [Acidimicrobiales bacterium]
MCPTGTPRNVPLGRLVVYHADPDFSDVLYDKDDTDPYRLLPFRSPNSLKVFKYAQQLAAEKERNPNLTWFRSCGL